MRSNYKYLMELKSYPLGDAVLDTVIKRVSPSLSSESFDSGGEIAVGISLCQKQRESDDNGCADCPVAGRCNHTRKDGYISWLAAPINCEGGLKLCQV